MKNESEMKRGVSSVKRHYNPSILKETLGKQNIMSEVKLELRKDAPFTVQQVLEWADKNVQSISKTFGNGWAVSWEAVKFTTAPTLYEALWSAWKEREVKS